MNLRDLVAEHTRSTIDLLKGDREELRRCKRRQETSKAREVKLKQEAAELEPALSENQRMLEDIRQAIKHLEVEIEERQLRLEEQRGVSRRVEDEYLSLQSVYTERMKGASKARKRGDQVSREVSDIESRIESYERRLDVERRSALHLYLDGVWARLLKAAREAKTVSKALSSRAQFSKARHENPALADLWEAREEWQRISRSGGPTQVRAVAKAELTQIEEQVEELFPGALSLGPEGRPDELEEVFLYRSQDGFGCGLIFFIPEEVLAGLDSGRQGEVEDLAVRAIWSLVRGLRDEGGEEPSRRPRFSTNEGFLVLETNRGIGEITGGDPITLDLAEGGRVSFIVSELPTEVSGALIDGDANS